MKKQLPVFRMLIDEDLESDAQVDFVALVPNPAIEKNFQAFSERQRFNIDNEDQRIISGPLMLADTPIYRNDPKMGEYFVVFDKANVMKACQKFFKCGFQNNVNLFHDPSMVPGGVTMFESFVADSARGISPMRGFEDAKDGSWFGSFKVDNPELWGRIKSGEFSGFSIEGMFGVEPAEPQEEAMVPLTPEDQKSILDEIKAILNAKISDETALKAIMGILEGVEEQD
jgi:Putative phage serine protease XkdF